MNEINVVTFDIGGTNMRAAVVLVKGTSWKLLDQLRRPTPNYLLEPGTAAMKRLDDLLDFIADYANFANMRFGAEVIAAAFPGPVQGAGNVLALPTMWGPDSQALCPIDFAGLIKERAPKMTVNVMNDVSAAGYRFVPECPDFAIFTLGSGLGLKVFLDGKPCVGAHGRGGELTHMVFDTRQDAPLCDCGGRGHLGSLVSGRAWQRMVNAAQLNGQSPDLLSFVEPLARAIAMLHFSLGLERFILAGGLVEGLGEPLRKAIVRRLPEQGWDVQQDWNAMVEIAEADDMHALIGGAFACSLNK